MSAMPIIPDPPLETVDGYLTKLAQEAKPGAVVLKVSPQGEESYFILREAGFEDVGLGGPFRHAKHAVLALNQAKSNYDKL